MAIDPRLLRYQQAHAAQQAMAARGVNRGVRVGPITAARTKQRVQRQRQQDRQREAGKSETRRISDQLQAAKGEDEGGFFEFKGIFDNPIVKTITKPLEIADIGRRGVISSLQSLAEALPEPLEYTPLGGFGAAALVDEDRARKRGENWLERIQDPTYGFGDVVHQLHTGNDFIDTWGNRAVGFAGDVALDPLTYLTAGTAKIPGAAGRAALVTKAAEKGLGREVAEALGRRGPSAIRDAETRALLELKDPGLRFAGRRVPGTGRVGQAVEEAVSAVRQPFIDTRFAKHARKWGVSRDPKLRAMFESVLAGEGDEALGLIESARHITGKQAERAGARRTVGAGENPAEDIARKFGDDATVVHAVEDGIDTPDTKMFRDLSEGMLKTQREAGASVGELAEGRPYVPHILTDKGKRALDQSDVPAGVGAARLGPEAQQFERRIKPGGGKNGTYTIQGQKFTPVTGTIKEANDWAQAALGIKMYEDSPAFLTARMVEDAGQTVGDVRYLQSLMGGEVPVAFRPSDTRATHAVERITPEDMASAQQLLGSVRTIAEGPALEAKNAALADRRLARAQVKEAAERLASVEQPLATTSPGPSLGAGLPGAPPVTAEVTQAREALRGAEANLAATAENFRQQAAVLRRTRKLGTGGNDSYAQVYKDLKYVADNPEIFGPATQTLLDTYGKDVAVMLPVDVDATKINKFLGALKSGDLTPVMEREMNEGLVKLANMDPLIGSDIYMTQKMHDVFTHFKEQNQANPGLLGKVLDAYTRFFKTYATATPGFHVRNAMSAMFMNLTEGVGFKTMLDGGTIWQAWRKNPLGDWKAALPDHLAAHADDVIDAVYASGAGGRYSAAELGQRAYGGKKRESRVISNPYTRYSRNLGEKVEGKVRAGLALHSLNEGEDVMHAIMRIKRVHFDYSDVNETDAAIRRYIPFWTFMSRNLPLQIQQMWLKPRTYAQYNSLQRNFDIDPEQAMYMPDYIRQQGTFRIADNLGIAPDIGATQINEDLSMLANPAKALSALNPALQVPLRLATNRDFYRQAPYRENDFEALGPELQPLGMLGQMFGLAEPTGQGLVAEKKYQQALYDLIPTLGLINRMGGTTESRQGRQAQYAANFIGLPLRFLDTEPSAKEIAYQRYQSTRPSPEEARLQALRQFQ